jgi:hypothetical protein
MIPRITPVNEELPEEVCRFYRGNIQFIKYDNGKVMPVIRGGATDDEESGDDTEEAAETDDDEESEDDEEQPAAEKKDPRIQELSRESAKYRRRLREERTAHEATKAELDKLKKDGTSDEKLKSENTRLSDELEKLKAQNSTLQITQEIHKYVGELNLDPKRVKAIIRVIDLDDVDVDDDGVSGVREALEQVAQDFPEWVVKPSGQDDNDDGGSQSRGQSSRKPAPKKRGGTDREALLKAYPALASGL